MNGSLTDNSTLTIEPTSSQITADIISELRKLPTDEAFVRLADILVIDDWKMSLRSSMLMSFHYEMIKFTKQVGYQPDQAAIAVSLLKQAFHLLTAKNLAVHQVMNLFRNGLLSVVSEKEDEPQPQAHGKSQRAANQAPTVFNPVQAKNLIDYAMTTLFRHHRLFQYAFNNHQPVHTTSICRTIHPSIPYIETSIHAPMLPIFVPQAAEGDTPPDLQVPPSSGGAKNARRESGKTISTPAKHDKEKDKAKKEDKEENKEDEKKDNVVPNVVLKLVLKELPPLADAMTLEKYEERQMKVQLELQQKSSANNLQSSANKLNELEVPVISKSPSKGALQA